MLVALYDGYCVICRSTRATIKALDWLNRVEFLDLHNWSEVERRYPQLRFEDLMGQIHVVGDDGRILAGFLATRRMLRELPLGFPLWLVLHLPGMGWLGPRIYRFIARHRYKINKWFGVDLPNCVDETCKV